MIEYFLENMWQVWAIVAVLCLLHHLLLYRSCLWRHWRCYRTEHLLADCHLCTILATQRTLCASSSPALPAQKRTQQTEQC